MEFHSMTAFAEHLGGLVLRQAEIEKALLERACLVVERRAKYKIGREDNAQAGPFIAWAQLADSTVAEKWRLGFFGQVSETDPLLRSGAVRDSIEHKVDGAEGHIGSDDQIMEYQELGTVHIPPRSDLGAALVEETDKVLEIIGEGATLWLSGEKVFGGKLDLIAASHAAATGHMFTENGPASEMP